MNYAELQVTTNYSFLRSGSSPGELVWEAIKCGHTAIGIADRNTLAGVVRAYAAVKDFYRQEGCEHLPRIQPGKLARRAGGDDGVGAHRRPRHHSR